MKEILDKKDVLDKLKALLSYAIIVDTSIPINENEGIGMGDIVQEIDDMDSLDPAVDLKEPFAEAQDKLDYKAMYFEGDATIKRIGVIVKEHVEQRFVKRETDVREKPEGK